jgi:hypothetical protein
MRDLPVDKRHAFVQMRYRGAQSWIVSLHPWMSTLSAPPTWDWSGLECQEQRARDRMKWMWNTKGRRTQGVQWLPQRSSRGCRATEAATTTAPDLIEGLLLVPLDSVLSPALHERALLPPPSATSATSAPSAPIGHIYTGQASPPSAQTDDVRQRSLIGARPVPTDDRHTHRHPYASYRARRVASSSR